jgi:squalene monooxygenase
MCHLLTGGGMTIALSDVVLLALMIAAELDLTDWHALTEVLHQWHWARKPLTATINILSVALYDLFSAEGAYSMSYITAAPHYYDSTQL